MSAQTFSRLPALTIAVCLLVGNSLNAQSVSIVQKSGSLVRGEITGMSPDSLTVKTASGPVIIETSNLRTLNFAQPPVEFARANNRFDAHRYDEGLEELAKMGDKPAGDALQHELAWMVARGSADSALAGGLVTPNDAGQVVQGFLQKYPTSFYTWQITERLGKLFSAIGREDLAQVEYSKLAGSSSEDFRMIGTFHIGLAKLAANDGNGAAESMAAVAASPAVGPEADDLRSRARALQARAMVLNGKMAEAKQAVAKLIENENPDNSALFSEAYNTLGVCHFQEGDLKAAALAFLHTDLLFFNQAEAHAEALWYLSQIWPKLDKQEAGWEAQESLKRLYKNSPWTARLGK